MALLASLKPVAAETAVAVRATHVTLDHDAVHLSWLELPIGK
jgi:hypothetical protein